jgi:hypothetical protein
MKLYTKNFIKKILFLYENYTWLNFDVSILVSNLGINKLKQQINV